MLSAASWLAEISFLKVRLKKLDDLYSLGREGFIFCFFFLTCPLRLKEWVRRRTLITRNFETFQYPWNLLTPINWCSIIGGSTATDFYSRGEAYIPAHCRYLLSLILFVRLAKVPGSIVAKLKIPGSMPAKWRQRRENAAVVVQRQRNVLIILRWLLPCAELKKIVFFKMVYIILLLEPKRI